MNFNLTQEQKEAAELARAFRDQLPNGIDNKVTNEIYSKLYFVRYQYMAVILDALSYGQTLSLKRLNEAIYNNLPKEIVKKTPEAMSRLIFIKMQAVGYITINETEKNYFEFSITDIGLEVARNMNIHNMAATTFFSYQTQKSNKLALVLAVSSVVIAIISAILAYKALVTNP
ncbi:hypothetical protein DYBT9623_05148 [Dyadobacter sp. CECT 9623]|uniref:Transcriptional regulator n=1 Tax=Dyadobacter linearis TaxID=2823330 RepID=A0ABM8UXR2_9BACT|nr:hypothetical protein [Dyadobacter sp. CECT 9623]CAG5074461.1 hypothetical protein DYBT9623_05148 [Dyadobacter sp. CECT 9623]